MDWQTGELKRDAFGVEYYSPTVKEQKDWFAYVKAREEAALKRNGGDAEKIDPESIVWHSEWLSRKLHALVGPDGERMEKDEITVDALELFGTDNLEAIDKAIKEDLRPKSDAATSQGGSKAKAA